MGKLHAESDIVRDEAGIVVGRHTEHPYAPLLKQIPMGGANMPGMGLLPEMRQLIAIHIWDNLRCSGPRDPLYVLREPKNVPRGAGRDAASLWVPVSKLDDPAFVESDGSVTVADVRDWSPQRLKAQKIAIAAEERRQRMVAQADPHIVTPAQAGEGDTPTPPGEGA